MLPNREFHPVAGLFPLLRREAFRELVADIQENGLLEPILVDAEGRILDGRNRYLACLQAGVEPRFVAWQGEGFPGQNVSQPESPPAASGRVPARPGGGAARQTPGNRGG